MVWEEGESLGLCGQGESLPIGGAGVLSASSQEWLQVWPAWGHGGSGTTILGLKGVHTKMHFD